ncbi:MAG: DUF4886 domain-containing protein, partial [Ruminococcaceae bacterium]|nr:DUF4886 domain-containing protein [Oscillospiraceae bacterium]
MKKATSILLAILMLVSLFTFMQASAEGVENLLPVTDENFIDTGLGTSMPSWANADALGTGAGIWRSAGAVSEFGMYVKQDTENVKVGSRSVKIDADEATHTEIDFPLAIGALEAGKTYTLQCYVKTNRVLTESSGAFIGVSFKKVVPEYVTVENAVFSEVLTGTKDWKFLSVTFTVPQDPNTIVIPHMGLYGAFSGTAWYDGFVLIEGKTPVADYASIEHVSGDASIAPAPIPDKYKNLMPITDENYEDIGLSTWMPSWVGSEALGTGAGVWASSNDTDCVTVDTQTVKMGKQSVKFERGESINTDVVFPLEIGYLEAGKTYTLQGYIKTDKIITENSGVSIGISFKSVDPEYVSVTNAVWGQGVSGTKDWTFISVRFTMPNDPTTIPIIELGCYSCHSGTAWFDGLVLIEGGTPVKDYSMIEGYDTSTVEPTAVPTVTDKPSDWAVDEVNKANKAGIVPEHINSKYTSDITRSDFCDLIIKMIEKKSGKAIADVIAGYADAKAEVSFPDTDSANVIAAAKLGIVNGRSSGAFDPSANITRQEAAKMLALAAKVLGADITASEVAFADADSIYAWAKEFIYYVNTIGVMNGTSTTTPPNFSPLRTYTREQSILTVYRLWGAIEKPEDPTAKRLRFLTIGNSYGKNSTEYIYQVAELCGYDEIVVGQLYIGGTELRHHLENINSNNIAYTYFKNTTGKWEIITMDEPEDPNEEWSMYVPMSFGLADEDWDYIVINAQSFGSGRADQITPYLQGIVDYVRTFSDAPLLWFMPWADTKDSINTPFIEWFDGEPLVMLQAVMDVAEDYIMPSGNFSAVIPSGTAIENVRTSFIGDNLDSDEHHLNELGCYISGMTWVAAIGGYDIMQMEYDGSFCTEEEFEVIKAAVDA